MNWDMWRTWQQSFWRSLYSRPETREGCSNITLASIGWLSGCCAVLGQWENTMWRSLSEVPVCPSHSVLALCIKPLSLWYYHHGLHKLHIIAHSHCKRVLLKLVTLLTVTVSNCVLCLTMSTSCGTNQMTLACSARSGKGGDKLQHNTLIKL